MKAIFKGKTSMGYEHGKQYDIKIQTRPYNNVDMIWVSCKGHNDCPYETIEVFCNNWVSFVDKNRSYLL